MARRLLLFAAFVTTFVLAIDAAPPPSGPVQLVRHPDYHAGTLVFSYLGDIWLASEDGSRARPLTNNIARETFPRFSPDGKLIAFSSDRHGNNDVFVVPVTGGIPTRLTFHSGNDEVLGWTRDSKQILFRATRGDGSFPSVATMYQIPASGGLETSLPMDRAAYGAYSPDGATLVYNRHPGAWTRQHYRGSAAADLWLMNVRDQSFRPLLQDERYSRFWPMWGSDGAIYYVADPLPDDKNVKPGSPGVRKSVKNIFKIPSAGGQPVQVTKHSSGLLYWPAISSDGRTIVYEENFGLWKLDVASGKTSEIKLQIAADEKENQFELVTVNNEVDSFDLSPSGRRAVISARGQIMTIATDRGDITRIVPDSMASRNQFPKWSPDGKYIAFVSDRSGRDEVWISDQEGTEPKRITDLDNEKDFLLWTPDSKSLLYTAAGKRLYGYSVADGKNAVITSTEAGRLGAVAVSPDSKWVSFSKQDRALRPHIFIAPIAGGEERHISDDSLLYAENNAVWTADGRYLVFTSVETASNGIATQGGIGATMDLYVLALRERDRDPLDRDIDNEAEGLAAEAAARQAGRGGGAGAGAGTAAQPPEVRIDWSGLARRAERLPMQGNSFGSLTPAPEGHAVALTMSTAGTAGRGGGDGGQAPGMYIVDVESGQVTPVPRAAETAGGRGGRGGGRGGAGGGGGGAMVFARDGRTLYFRSGNGLFAASIPQNALAGGGAGRGGRGGGAAAQTAPQGQAQGGGGTARQVTYTANIEVDRRALRSQVYHEGWRIMKNRFYDPAMHGADWPAARKRYAPLLDHVADNDELHSVMMMMIGELNASHTGVSGGPNNLPRTEQTRYPGFDLVTDPSGYLKVGHIYKNGPADRDYLKIQPGHFVLSVNGADLKSSENYWRHFTMASGSKFHFTLNDKPVKEGAWKVTVEPAGNMGDLRYNRWVDERRAIVDKLTNGEFGYLHIRAMNAPSLRQFVLDLASARTKKALVIDQRFNGGGGIEQELLAILSGRQYQYTIGRDAGFRQPRPANFYGPMVVMQNERSGSNAEMFPAGFRALGLGKVVGVPTAAAVIGTGSYTLLDGSTIRTPGTGVWTASGENMENWGVPPDVYVDNLPGDFLKGRDAQLEKAVEVLREALKRTTTSSSSGGR
jgi:tricorn protease